MSGKYYERKVRSLGMEVEEVTESVVIVVNDGSSENVEEILQLCDGEQ